MIYAVCFKDNHPGKQTHEREAVSMSYFQVKAFFQCLDRVGLEDCSVIMQTSSDGQEAVFALLSMPSTEQPMPWWMSFLSALQLSLAASYIFVQASSSDCKIEPQHQHAFITFSLEI